MLEGRRDPSAEWWRKAVVVPARRAWVVVAARLRRKKHDDRGLLVKLHDDIQTCAYQDVQVMWEILQRSETEKMAGAPGRSSGSRHGVATTPSTSSSGRAPDPCRPPGIAVCRRHNEESQSHRPRC